MDWLVMAMRAARKLRDAPTRLRPRDDGASAPRERAEPSILPSPTESPPEPDPRPEPEPEMLRAQAPADPQPPVVAPPGESAPNARSTPSKEVDLSSNQNADDYPSEESTGPRIPLHLIDRDALDVVRRLRRAGFSAYLVGGCVRDLLIGLSPKDFDVATNARPEQVRRVFRNCRIIGRRFRLAHVVFRGGKVIETSTFRASVEPTEEDGDLLIRHDNVFGSEEEDARRRDFTINGLFYDVASARVVDHVGGLEDLARRRLRMIGDPDIRLQEDPVRVIRAVRISAKTGFEIDAELLQAMLRHKSGVHRCPRARITEEMLKLFRSGHAEASLRHLARTDILDVILPSYVDPILNDPELCADIFTLFRGLDTRIARGPVTDPVIFATLCLPFVDGDWTPKELGENVEEIATAFGATRKASERVRQMYLAQRTLMGTSKGRKSRVGPETLARRPFFLDALDFLETRVLAAGASTEEIERLRTTARMDAHAEEPEDPRPSRPRRRRRRPE